jgi:hypothetical protein
MDDRGMNIQVANSRLSLPAVSVRPVALPVPVAVSLVS